MVTTRLSSILDAPTHELERVAESANIAGVLELVKILEDDGVEYEIELPNLARGTAVEEQSALFLPQYR